jgi:hypothetical protein
MARWDYLPMMRSPGGEHEGEAFAEGDPPGGRVGLRLRAAPAGRLSPERTRRATLFERLTVRRVGWEQLVRLNRYLEFVGKLATVLWVLFLVTAVLGVDWKAAVEDTVNSGEPVKAALVVAVAAATFVFVAVRSLVGFARWRIQRELWRRDVERMHPG